MSNANASSRATDNTDSGSATSAGNGGEKSGLAWLGSFFTTLPGLLTGLAALITALATAFFGGTQVSGQSAAAPAPTVTVTQVVTAQPVGQAAPSGGSQATTAAPQITASTASPSGMELDSSGVTLVNSSVDQLTTDQPQQVGAATYTNAIRFSCSASTSTGDATNWGYNDLIYDVAGYSTFDATFGIPDNADNAANNSAIIKFYADGGSTEIGDAYTISLDNPAHVDFSLQGMSQLEIDCQATNAGDPKGDGDDIDVAIVNGTLSK
jgi:hypothetical protein